MEMSGLDPAVDVILEIATIITDNNLNLIAKGPELVLSQPAALFDRMDEWNQTHHTDSGLWQKVLDSTVTVEEAEAQTLAFIKEHSEDKHSPLCGNSIHQDRRFLHRYMPRIDDYLSYRLIDVSSIKEVITRWGLMANITATLTKKNGHRAMDDILESVEELKFYREHIFPHPATPSAPPSGGGS